MPRRWRPEPKGARRLSRDDHSRELSQEAPAWALGPAQSTEPHWRFTCFVRDGGSFPAVLRGGGPQQESS